MEPIRILHVVAIMNRGGLETMIMNHYRKIDRTKFQFDFLVHRKEEGVFDEEIKALGGKIFYLPKFNPLKIWNYNKALDNFFRHNTEYKIVHSHYNALSMWVLRTAKKHKIPVRIAHSHLAYPNFNYQSPIYWYARQKINKYCNYKFACSKEAGDWLFGEDYSSEVVIFKNAIPLDKFIFDSKIRDKVREDLKLTNKLVLGHVGRFHPSKNHKFLVEVFHEVYKRNNSSHLVLIGDGSEKEKIKSMARELEVEKNISFLGIREDVAEIMQAMDVFVFPSKFEALPVTLVEAQASGLRVIASDTLTSEVAFTDSLTFKSLDSGRTDWADEILHEKNKSVRKNAYQDIKQSGYDIEENIAFLTKFYTDSINN